MNYYTDTNIIGQPEYDMDFWDYMKNLPVVEDKISKGRKNATGSYSLPATSAKKYEANINSESIFRSISSVFTNYIGDARIWIANSDDIATFADENETIPVVDLVDDFTQIAVDRHKLAIFFRLPYEFIKDSGINFENYLLKRFSKCFARAEDKAYITGTGTGEPTGILHNTNGANTGVTTSSLTYDDVIKLYFSVKPEYRKNGVWLMNDETAQTLRTLKDGAGNYLWRNTDDTILGKKVMISEYMPNATSGKKPIAFGDFSYYWIVKRSPVTAKTLEELFAKTNQIGYLAYEFLDGKLINKDAVKVLKIAQ